MSEFLFTKVGFQGSLQDLGRDGYTHIGVTTSGAMDEFALNASNILLDNTQGTNALEITLGNLDFTVQNGETNIAITGADTPILLNNSPIKMWESCHVKQGDKVQIGFPKKGLRIYLGVSGGFRGKKVLDSYSTTMKEGFGNPIKKDDILCSNNKKYTEKRRLLSSFIPCYKDAITLHVVLGYQHESFDAKELEKFFSSTYEVTNQSDRMGFRLSGYALKNVKEGLISEGIAYGAVQIPPHGQPIVLLKERQTIGGYPKIGSVLPTDCFMLSQCSAGTKVNFKPISLKKATDTLKEFSTFFTT